MNGNKNIAPKLQEALKSIWDSLSDEQKEKAKACKTMDELMELAGREGMELPDELLDDDAGGGLLGRLREPIKERIVAKICP